MNADFLDAHNRHWQDAESLFAAMRLANADHLYGLAAECGLKCLCHVFGMQLSGDGDPKNGQDRVHINHIGNCGKGFWLRYGAYCSGHLGANYPLPATNPFSNWDATQRYADQHDFTRPLVEPHQQGAKAIHELIGKAKQEGLI